MQFAEVKNLERMTHCSRLIQYPGIISEPCEHLLCSRGVDPFESSGETRDVVWITGTGSTMSTGVKEINRPILDLLELCLCLNIRQKRAHSINDHSVHVLVLREDAIEDTVHDLISFGFFEAGHSQDPLCTRMNSHEPPVPIGPLLSICTGLARMLLIAGTLDVDLSIAVQDHFLYLVLFDGGKIFV